MSKSTIFNTLILTTTLLASGCASTPNANQNTRNLELLQNKNWVLSHIGSAEYKIEANAHNVPSIQFGSDYRVSGSDG